MQTQEKNRFRPATRGTDPVTSFEAERHMNRSGKRLAQQRLASGLVARHPGRTAAELAKLGPLDRYALNRRLPELVGAGVEKGERRTCAVLGSTCLTWWPEQLAKGAA